MQNHPCSATSSSSSRRRVLAEQLFSLVRTDDLHGMGTSARVRFNLVPQYATGEELQQPPQPPAGQSLWDAKVLGSLNLSVLALINYVAVAVHFSLAVTCMAKAASADPQRTVDLKVDRVHLVPSLKPGSNLSLSSFPSGGDMLPLMLQRPADFVQLVSPWTGKPLASAAASNSNDTIAQKCHAAVPTRLPFMGDDNFNVDMWTYPVRAGVVVNIGWCLAGFFALSFAFQLLAGQLNLIQDPAANDRESSIMHFNWLRFVEYSFSGSLVLYTIALLCGVTDHEVLACIYSLAWGCMILGLVAEVCLRASVVVFELGSKVAGAWLLRGFWVAHVAGWVCMVVPWVIVWLHFMHWYSVCDAESLNVPGELVQALKQQQQQPQSPAGAAGVLDIVRHVQRVLGLTISDQDGSVLDKRPPDWVVGIMAAEFLLYVVFGLVQLVQGVMYTCYRRLFDARAVEASYILLSLVAKTTLGGIVLRNVFI